MKVAVTSLRFAPGHIAHLRAYQALFSALGCTARLFLAPAYRDFLAASPDITFTDRPQTVPDWKPDAALAYNISVKNISLARQCNRAGIRFFYTLHEPWDSLKELLALRGRIPRRVAANVVNALTARFSYKVILASENGKEKYERYMKGCNGHYASFPLIFCDDYDASLSIPRTRFSFIGGFTESRGCREFLDFVRYAVGQGLDIPFLIATRNAVDGWLNDATLQDAVRDGRLTVCAGRPMTTEEINRHYRESVCVWNAYKSSTQSGVLANALMQGAPVLATRRGDSADVIFDKKNGCFLSLPYDNAEIAAAYGYVKAHLNEMETEARRTFQTAYEYKARLEQARTAYEIDA